MYIQELHLKNFRSFTDITIAFSDEKASYPSKTVVFIGNNGTGKTTLLEALKINLSWLAARIRQDNGLGLSPTDTDIQNGQTFTQIGLQVQYAAHRYHWQAGKTLTGHLKATDSQLSEASQLANLFKGELTQNSGTAALPLLVYYPVERGVLNIPLSIGNHQQFAQLDGYKNTLIGRDFRQFFTWFREREDYENERQREQWQALRESFSGQEDPQLSAVRAAVKIVMPGFDRLRIQRQPLQMLIDKNGATLDVAQLSQGEKSMLALVGDIARRLAMMNPAAANPLEGFGIVLIDEIDLHLHPKWQRTIVGNLNRTFPNCQFILTTHSPIIISESPDLLCYSLNNGEIQKLGKLYGMDVNQVLLQDMDTPIRNADIQQTLDAFRDHLQDGELNEAQALLAELEQRLAIDNLELSKAKLLMKRWGAQHAVHH
jgi:predicted ATP-binding protein involved in virulence